MYLAGANFKAKLVSDVSYVVSHEAYLGAADHIVDPVLRRSIFSTEIAFAAAAFTSTQKSVVFN